MAIGRPQVFAPLVCFSPYRSVRAIHFVWKRNVALECNAASNTKMYVPYIFVLGGHVRPERAFQTNFECVCGSVRACTYIITSPARIPRSFQVLPLTVWGRKT